MPEFHTASRNGTGKTLRILYDMSSKGPIKVQNSLVNHGSLFQF